MHIMKKTKPNFIERQAVMAAAISKLCALIDAGDYKGRLGYHTTSAPMKFDEGEGGELIATGYVVFNINGMEANLTQLAPDENPIDGEDTTEWMFSLTLNLDWGCRYAMLGLDGDDEISEEQLEQLVAEQKEIADRAPPTIDSESLALIRELDNAAQAVDDDPHGEHWDDFVSMLEQVKSIDPILMRHRRLFEKYACACYDYWRGITTPQDKVKAAKAFLGTTTGKAKVVEDLANELKAVGLQKYFYGSLYTPHRPDAD